MKFKILDLFSGAGGFSKGFSMEENFQPVLATDFNEPALKTYKKNFPDTEIILGDITKDEIRQKIISEAKSREVNMIIGGPPCQGFSNKGKKLGLNDSRNFLFLEYLSIVKELQPQVFVIENVKAMLTAANGYFIDKIKSEINKLGYEMTYGVLTASDFGVPQKRQRAIIIASRNKKILLPSRKIKKNVTVRDAISDLAYLNSGEGGFCQEYIRSPESLYQEFMRKDSINLFNHVATAHSKETLLKLSFIPPEKGKEYLPEKFRGNQKFKTTWGRLKWDTQSPTIDTRFDTPSNGTNTHPELNRAITPREAARLQSFPDNFIFIGKKSHITKQIGNAVPPLMSFAIAKTIREQINETL